MDSIVKVFGFNANLYTDVLRVSPTASSSEIREAFFCLRYDIYQTLSRTDDGPNGGSNSGSHKKPPLTPQERRKIEDQMNAITAAFRILSDGNKRREYDARLKTNGKAGRGSGAKFRGGIGNGNGNGKVTPSYGSARIEATDEMGFPISAADDDEYDNGGGAGRSIFRKSGPNTIPGGMNNAAPRAVARPASEWMNPRRTMIGQRQEAEEEDEEEERTKNGNSDDVNTSEGNIRSAFSREVDEDDDDRAVMGNNFENEMVTNPSASGVVSDQQQQQHQNNEESREHDESFETAESSVPPMLAGVDDLNIREQMLYKNQMFLQKQQRQQMQEQGKNSNHVNSDNDGVDGRIGSKYQTEDRTDWLVERRREESITRKSKEQQRQIQLAKKKRSQQKQLQKATSPKGVDQFYDRDNVTSDGEDDTNTYTSNDDDDTRTYGSNSYYDDSQYDETTLGETTLEETTLGESTWASEYDDGTSVGTDRYDSESNVDYQAKYKPSHKNGNVPQPILRTSSSSKHYNNNNNRSGIKPSAMNRQSSANSDRRVTIHAHRGRGEDKDYRSHKKSSSYPRSSRLSDSDYDAGGAFCPFPSMKEINEEVMGTYKDATSAFHQVLHAFVISPDDIDRVADKIRDAKAELKENYDEQVRERQGLVRSGSRDAGDVKKGGGRKVPIDKAFSS